jgi:aryl-alcohol dehydrogenase-like predicted oxidoreductase
MGQIAEAAGKSYSQIALNWLLERAEVSSVIIGARTPEQLENNLAATGWQLTEEQRAELNQVSAIEPGYPYRMMALYGQR